MSNTEITPTMIQELLAKFTPYKELFAYELAGQGWAVCWKGSKGEPIPVCHMRWTDGLTPEIEERLENEVKLFAAAPAIARYALQQQERFEADHEMLEKVVAERNTLHANLIETASKLAQAEERARLAQIDVESLSQVIFKNKHAEYERTRVLELVRRKAEDSKALSHNPNVHPETAMKYEAKAEMLRELERELGGLR